jgi:hypothetical protein
MRLIDADALIEDFKSRLVDCNDWIENAKDKETKIRASAVKTFIAEVILTINNAPTVIRPEYARPTGAWIYKEFDAESGISRSYWCSNCGEPKSQWCDDFCQRCGADMRKEQKNEQTTN